MPKDDLYAHSAPNYDEVQPQSARGAHYAGSEAEDAVSHLPGERRRSRILQLKNGYGFLSNEPSPKNLFFFWEDLDGIDFNELNVGDLMEYEIGENERGECARHITRVSDASQTHPEL